MIAVDTNVLVRLVIGDDARQLELATALLLTEAVYVPITVMMETEWVLRSRYQFGRERVATALTALLALPRVTAERGERLTWAIGCYAQGGDFADLIHIACLPREIRTFASFDQGITVAGQDCPGAVCVLA